MGGGHPRDEHHAAMGGFLLVPPAFTSIRTMRSDWCPRTSKPIGAAPTFTSVGPSTRCYTCSMPASGIVFLHDEGVLAHPEPYKKLFHQGLILGADGNKMSKSVGNVVSPDVVIDAYGADSLRLFEMFSRTFGSGKALERKGYRGREPLPQKGLARVLGQLQA